jgi:hypothetical protein
MNKEKKEIGVCMANTFWSIGHSGSNVYSSVRLLEERNIDHCDRSSCIRYMDDVQ